MASPDPGYFDTIVGISVVSRCLRIYLVRSQVSQAFSLPGGSPCRVYSASFADAPDCRFRRQIVSLIGSLSRQCRLSALVRRLDPSLLSFHLRAPSSQASSPNGIRWTQGEHHVVRSQRNGQAGAVSRRTERKRRPRALFPSLFPSFRFLDDQQFLLMQYRERSPCLAKTVDIPCEPVFRLSLAPSSSLLAARCLCSPGFNVPLLFSRSAIQSLQQLLAPPIALDKNGSLHHRETIRLASAPQQRAQAAD